MPIETELKLKVGAGERRDLVKELLALLPVQCFSRVAMVNIYFDTAELDLNRNKVALRIRQKQGRFIQTLKTQGQVVDGLHQRGEWEWELENAQLDEHCLKACSAWPSHIDVTSLRPLFQSNFERRFALLEWAGAEVELALDSGAITVQGECKNKVLSEPIHEVEVELVSGASSGVLELGRVLQSELGLEVYDQSKAERGYRLYRASTL